MAQTINFSKNAKLNAVLNEIAEDLQEMGRNEVIRYFNEFKREIDYNIVQYGNLLIYYDDVREMYRRNGYKSIERMSNNKLWDIYKAQVGYVARMYIKELF